MKSLWFHVDQPLHVDWKRLLRQAASVHDAQQSSTSNNFYSSCTLDDWVGPILISHWSKPTKCDFQFPTCSFHFSLKFWSGSWILPHNKIGLHLKSVWTRNSWPLHRHDTGTPRGTLRASGFDWLPDLYLTISQGPCSIMMIWHVKQFHRATGFDWFLPFEQFASFPSLQDLVLHAPAGETKCFGPFREELQFHQRYKSENTWQWQYPAISTCILFTLKKRYSLNQWADWDRGAPMPSSSPPIPENRDTALNFSLSCRCDCGLFHIKSGSQWSHVWKKYHM